LAGRGDLLAFPTRRSSDLLAGPVQANVVEVGWQEPRVGEPARQHREAAGGGGLHDRDTEELLPRRGHHHARREQVPSVVVAVQVDRKSTRLNSSHVKISYA